MNQKQKEFLLFGYDFLYNILPKGDLLFFNSMDYVIISGNEKVKDTLHKINPIQKLDLFDCDIPDVLFLENILPNVEKLILPKNKLSELSPILSFASTNLSHLDLDWNLFENISNLESFPEIVNGLKLLSFARNQIRVFPKIEPSNSLEKVYFYENEITDISNLKNASFPNLIEFSLSCNFIRDISVLTTVSFPNLEHLWLYNNPIQDYTPLFNCDFPKLRQLRVSLDDENMKRNLEEKFPCAYIILENVLDEKYYIRHG